MSGDAFSFCGSLLANSHICWSRMMGLIEKVSPFRLVDTAAPAGCSPTGQLPPTPDLLVDSAASKRGTDSCGISSVAAATAAQAGVVHAAHDTEDNTPTAEAAAAAAAAGFFGIGKQ